MDINGDADPSLLSFVGSIFPRQIFSSGLHHTLVGHLRTGERLR